MFKTDIAFENWNRKYRYGNETEIQTWERVARALANVEREPEKWYDMFLRTIVKFDENNKPVGLKCTPGGRITANIGTGFKGATLLNCFINGPVSGAHIKYNRKSSDGSVSYPVEYNTPDTPDDLINIFLTIMEQAKTLASEGGYGINIDWIRPRGSLIKGTGIKHPGVVSYLKIFDAVAECIVKGDNDGYVDKIRNYLGEEKFEELKQEVKKETRKGAQMVVLSCSHPDAEEFIRAKQTSGVLTKFNMSVLVDDLFMQQVEKDGYYDQSFGGKVYKKVKARDFYNLIMESCYNRAEPGVLFFDNMQRNNPVAYLGKANATNPCFDKLTEILTKDGITDIASIIDKPIKVWNGVMWESTIFKVTGENKKVVDVTISGLLDDGTNVVLPSFIATEDHKIIKGFSTTVYDSIDAYKVPISELSTELTVKLKTGSLKIKKIDVFHSHTASKVYCCTVSTGMFALGNGLMVSNCGEIPGIDTLTTVCLLGSVNLTQYVDKRDDKPFFNWDLYKKDVKTFSRMLDNVCDLSNAPLPSYEWAIKNFRQYGMGINGFGSTLMMLGIPYNSAEAIEFAGDVAKTKENITWQTSAMLAKEKGLFPVYNKEKFENTEYFKSNRLSDDTKELLRKYGARNAKTTTCAPAGTTAIICDNTSNGIEPVFLLEYERKVTRKDWPEGMTQDNVMTLLARHDKKDYTYWEGKYNGNKYYYEPHNRGLCDVKHIRDYGYQWLLENFPNKDHKRYLITTKDLSVEDHVAIQSIMQRHTNQSISKTINLPKKYPFEDFKDLYLMGWKNGLIGLTTYREGSMESVLSSIDSEDNGIIKKDLKLPNEFINGPTSVIKREGMKFYIHFSYFPDDADMKHPVCLWIYTNTEEKGASIVCNKASRELAKLALSCGIENKIIQHAIEKSKNDYPHNRLGRMVSLCLRHNVPRVEILTALRDIEGDNISTLLTAVRKFIGKTVEDGTVIKGIRCKNDACKSDRLVFEAGCVKCADCGNQECGF